MGLTSLYGSVFLVAAPDGHLFKLPLAWLEKTPFRSYLVPGLLLFGVGFLQVIAATAAYLRIPNWRLSILAASAMVVWIVVQRMMLPPSFLQAVYLVAGLLAVWTAVELKNAAKHT